MVGGGQGERLGGGVRQVYELRTHALMSGPRVGKSTSGFSATKSIVLLCFLYYPSLSCRKSTLRFGNTNRHAIHTHQEGGGVISNKICYLLLSDIIQIPEGIYRVSLKICCT